MINEFTGRAEIDGTSPGLLFGGPVRGPKPQIQGAFSFAESTGTRLEACEVYNWGNFDNAVWAIDAAGGSTLVCGESGSGKTSFIDALSSLVFRSSKINYNSSGGEKARVRTKTTYVCGSIGLTGESGSADAKPQYIRWGESKKPFFSVILARFSVDERPVTVACVMCPKASTENRLGIETLSFYVTAERSLSIATDFSGFGTRLEFLKAKLESLDGVSIHNDEGRYLAKTYALLGLTEQAADLLVRTISLKKVDSIPQFVKQQMLMEESNDREVENVIGTFEDLNAAHEIMLSTERQIELLKPLSGQYERYSTALTQKALEEDARAHLSGFVAENDLAERLQEEAGLHQSIVEIRGRVERSQAAYKRCLEEQQIFAREYAVAGGELVGEIERQIDQEKRNLEAAAKVRTAYKLQADRLGLCVPKGIPSFAENLSLAGKIVTETEDKAGTAEKEWSNAYQVVGDLTRKAQQLKDDIAILGKTGTNIDPKYLELRQAVANACGVSPERLPFVGELLQVKEGEERWAPAIQRVMRSFALSLLVEDDPSLYSKVTEFLDKAHLGLRLVYNKAETGAKRKAACLEGTVGSKIAIRPGTPFHGWLADQLSQKFNFSCAENLDSFRNSERAITARGQIKENRSRHIKDDRRKLGDEREYCLGWTNTAKIAAMRKEQAELALRITAAQKSEEEQKENRTALAETVTAARRLIEDFKSYEAMDTPGIQTRITTAENKRRDLIDSSDLLTTLKAQLDAAGIATDSAYSTLKQHEGDSSHLDVQLKNCQNEQQSARDRLAYHREEVGEVPDEYRNQLRAFVDQVAKELSINWRAADSRTQEQQVRKELQSRIDATTKRIGTARDAIAGAIDRFKKGCPPQVADEFDSGVAAVPALLSYLDQLVNDDLVRHRARFEELLYHETADYVGTLSSKLDEQRKAVVNAIDAITDSLQAIAFDPKRGTKVRLQATPARDEEVRLFWGLLRRCTERVDVGDRASLERRFLSVKELVEKFQGKFVDLLGTEYDAGWKKRILDVRTWFEYVADEIGADDAVVERHSDAGGKSGGQKEKIAYTLLGAALANHFGIKEGRPGAFRLIVIDEAFKGTDPDFTRHGLELFTSLGLQMVIVTPNTKFSLLDDYVDTVHMVEKDTQTQCSVVRRMPIDEFIACRSRSDEKRLALRKAQREESAPSEPGSASDAFGTPAP
jgi:uncharacterized protein YPO0396